MDNETLQQLLSRYRSARAAKPETGESSMTADFRISETTVPTPAPVSTSTVENQPSSQTMTCCPSDNTLENQPVAKLAKPESFGKPPIPPHSSENNVQCHPTPLKSNAPSNPLLPSNLSTDFSTPRFKRVPLRNLSSSRSLSSSISSHDSSSTSSSIKAAPMSAVKPYSTYSNPESKNKENLVSLHTPELSASASELKMTALLEEKTQALEELKLSSKKSEEKLKKETAELKKENEYIVGQYKVLQEKMSQHSSIEGEGSVQTQLGQKVVISGKHYNIQKDAIAKGGSCRVFSGLDCTDNTQVAVKVVNLNKLPDKAVGVLQEEIALLHALKEEDNIINLLNDELRPNKSQLLIVLEFGESDLHDYLKKQKPLNKSEKLTSYYGVMAMWHQMLSAVHSIHKHNIIHKDLKPQNFLLVKGKLKLIDFGISERIQADVTSMVINQPEGTPNYIAPELLGATFGSAASNRLGYCSDVYSLGCILYKMCFGVTPYQHIDKMHMKYYAITSPEPIRIPTLPHQDLVQIMTACLNKDRQKRPTIAQLMGFKGGENID